MSIENIRPHIIEGNKRTGMALSSICLAYEILQHTGKVVASNYDVGRHYGLWDKKKFLEEIGRTEELKRAEETFIRASGDCLCPVCGEQYRKHPAVVGAEWLNRLCDGVYVKL